MVSQVTGINSSVTFAKNAIKYLNEQPLEKEGILSQAKSCAISGSVMGSLFQTPTIIYGIKNKKQHGGFLKAIGVKQAKSASAAANTAKKAGLFKNLSAKIGFDKVSAVVSNKMPKCLKGAGMASMAVLSGAIQAFTEVIPAFKNGGTKEGFKQIGKSAVNVGVDTVCYTAGMKLGATIGGALGGPVGGILGGVLGMVLGGVASTVATGLTEKVIGKNYSEKAIEAQEDAQATQIAQDAASMQELQTLVAQKIAQEQQTGNANNDTGEMLRALSTTNANGNVSFGSMTTPQAQIAMEQTALPAQDYGADINQSIRNNISNKQSQGQYELYNLPKNADGSFDKSIYNITPFLNQKSAV